MLLPVQGVWAIDADNDGSDSVEEHFAGTSDNDPTHHPYWWKTFNGDSTFDQLGYSVGGAGDVNGDGVADLIAGAYLNDNNGFSSGSARVILASDLMNDSDLDYHLDAPDNCRVTVNPDPADIDLDGVGDLCDNCPVNSNPAQADMDDDGIGNACDPDCVPPPGC